MNINNLYDRANSGDKSAREQLFSKLYESFNLFVKQRIWNKEDCEEIVQEALMTINKKYEKIKFEKSFGF